MLERTQNLLKKVPVGVILSSKKQLYDDVSPRVKTNNFNFWKETNYSKFGRLNL